MSRVSNRCGRLRRWATPSALSVALMVALSSCHSETSAPAFPADVPVFIISIDTLRSDHIGCYGARQASTPRIDQLAREGLLFERAFSHVPQTFPSHTTILTGLLPPNNGVRDNIGYTLDARIQTLPQELHDHGYSTGAAVSTYVLRRATGIDRGFDSYDDDLTYKSALDVTAERDGKQTAAALERWLDGTQSRRVFGFLHLYEPHAPYTPPPEFAKGRAPYDGEVSYADSIVGGFLDDLKRRGLYDDALIVLLSDHGEGLGDHGEDEHGVFVYRESLQVPLIVKLPHGQRGGRRIRDLAALTDVMPTILSAAGVSPLPRFDGIDLLAPRRGARKLYAESYFPRLHIHWHELVALIDDKLHFIDAPKRELYAYTRDPRELRNLADSDRRSAFAMAEELGKSHRPFQAPTQVDSEDQRKLAALGYIGSAQAAPGGDYPDPKDRIQYIRLFHRASSLVAAGQYDDAIALLGTLTTQNPTLADEWLLLAQAYASRGEHDRAIATLRRANQLFPGSSTVLLPLAQALADSGKLDDARVHAELALKQDPVLARETLAHIAFARHNLAEARRQIEMALAFAPNRTTTLMALAAIERASNDWQGELETLDHTASELETRHLAPIRDLQGQRGEALLHLQRGAEAEQAFRSETQSFPDNFAAWGNLAIITAVQGRRDAAMQMLDEVVLRYPTPEAKRMASETKAAMTQ